MPETRSFSGHSMILNTLFVVLNIAGLALFFMGFLEVFAAIKVLFIAIGASLVGLTSFGIILFKGKIMMATVSRVIVGVLFVVSGLIKANDPIGFSYKLQEYFEDGALAYRMKEAFGWTSFSLEFLIDAALWLAVVICVLEILLGFLLIIGGKARLTAWLLIPMMLFFTFLTWHTANCVPGSKFTDEDTYALHSSEAQQKLEASKKNHDIRIISKNNEEVVVQEQKMVQCVSDCGCFGDALKARVGRSLLPSESFLKDIVLLYLSLWFFLAQRWIKPNSVRQNWKIIPIVGLLFAALSFLLDWYFPLLFGGVGVLIALWIYRSGGVIFGNHYGSILLLSLMSFGFVFFVLRYDPLRDFRSFAVGNDLNEQVKKGLLDTIQFNPTMSVHLLSDDALTQPFIQKQLKDQFIKGLLLKDKLTNKTLKITAEAYNIESYSEENYTILDTIEMRNDGLEMVSANAFLLSAPKVILIISQSLDEINNDVMQQLADLTKKAKVQKVPILFITSGSYERAQYFAKSHKLDAFVFVNEALELKTIARSNPSLVILKKGKVVGKYTEHALPEFEWITTNLLSK